MASEGEACCESDPNFAVICAFLEKFGPACGISNVDFLLLQEMLENTHEVSPELIDLHIKLLRKARKSVSSERWERAIIKLCHTFCSQDAWEMERFGYRKAKLSAKIRILKELLEMQFDYNPKFKTEINKMTAEELRSQPIGRDKMGHAYWLQCDENCQLRIYKEDPDEETWTLVAKDREGFVSLISQLNSGDSVELDLEPLINEDSNSTEVEKPIVDTGQVVDSSDSKKEETDSSNDVEIKNEDSSNDVETKKSEKDDSEDDDVDGEQKIEAAVDNEELSVKDEESVQTTDEILEDDTDVREEYEEDGSESALNLSQKKPVLRIKSITELMSQPSQAKNYVRPTVSTMQMPIYSAPVAHRKADSGFKRFLPENYTENAENLKKPRLSKPTLSQESSQLTGKPVDDEDDESCEVGEAIEEPVMYVYGEGNGKDCQTGNEKVDSSSDCDKKNDSSQEITAGALNDKSDVENSINSSKGDCSLSVNDKGEHKSRFKLGTIIDVKSDGNTFTKSPTKKSRWDVGKPLDDVDKTEVSLENKTPTEATCEKDKSVKRPMFFFGPGCLAFKPSVIGETPTNVPEKPSESKESDLQSAERVHENENSKNVDETDNVAVSYRSPVVLNEKSQETDVSVSRSDGKKVVASESSATTAEKSVAEAKVLEEIKEQLVDAKEDNRNVSPPCITVSLPSESSENKDEVKEKLIEKKTAYECGIEEHDERVESKKKEEVEQSLNKTEITSPSVEEKLELTLTDKSREVEEEHLAETVAIAFSPKGSRVSETDEGVKIEQITETVAVSLATEEVSDSKIEEDNKEQIAETIAASLPKEELSVTRTEEGNEEQISKTLTCSSLPEESSAEIKGEQIKESLAVSLSPEATVHRIEEDNEEQVTKKSVISALPEESSIEVQGEQIMETAAVSLPPESSVSRIDEANEEQMRKESAILSLPEEISVSGIDEVKGEQITETASVSSPSDQSNVSRTEDVSEKPKTETISVSSVTEESISATGISESKQEQITKTISAFLPTEKASSNRISEEVNEEQRTKSIAAFLPSKEPSISEFAGVKEEQITKTTAYQCGTEGEVINKLEETSETVQKIHETDFKNDRDIISIEKQAKSDVKVCATELNSEVVKSLVENKTENSEDIEVSEIKDSILIQPLQSKDATPSVCNEATNISVESEVSVVAKIDENVNEKRDSSGKSLADIIDKMSDNRTVNTQCNASESVVISTENALKTETVSSEKQLIDGSTEEVHEKVQTDAVNETCIVSKNISDKFKNKESLLGQLEEKKDGFSEKLNKENETNPTEELVVDVASGNQDLTKQSVKTICDTEVNEVAVDYSSKKERVVETEIPNAANQAQPVDSDAKLKEIVVNQQVEQKASVEKEKESEISLKTEEMFSEKESVTLNLSKNAESKSLASISEVLSVTSPVPEEPVQVAAATERRITRASRNKPSVVVEQKKRTVKNKKADSDKTKPAVEETQNVVGEKNTVVEDDKNVPSNVVDRNNCIETKNDNVDVKAPTLVCVDEEADVEKTHAAATATTVVDGGGDDDDDDDNVDNSANPISDQDPLACTDEEIEKSSSAPLTLTSFTFDYDGEPPVPIQIPKLTRKRSRLSTESKPDEEVAEKRQKLRGKRAMDAELRRSIENQKSNAISSSEDDNGAQDVQLVEGGDDEEDEQQKPKLFRRGKGKRKRKWMAKKSRLSPVPSSDVTSETSRADSVSTPPVKKAGGPRKRKTTLLGLDVPADPKLLDEPVTGVRQSRRIAQLKIKEEAERRKIEETVLNELKADHKKKKSKKSEDKDFKVDTKKKSNQISDDESTVDADIDDKKKKRKRKHKDFRKLFDGKNPWLHSSDSSSSNEVEEEEEEDVYTEEEPKSDHEFSPESDLEDAGDVQPLKRARTAKKESDVDEVDDCACEKCGKKDHPEWILLCDGCDNGWHCSCLRPALLVIPEGDWFCPPCQHVKLIKNLQAQLKIYDKNVSKKNIENRRKERLAYVGISLNNVLPAKETEPSKPKRVPKENSEDESEEDESESEVTQSESSSDSDDEPIYRLRERRQAHSYRFNDYDELINSAIQDEMEAVKGAGNQGRGKDISTIVNAEKEEEAQKAKVAEEVVEEESMPPVVPKEVERSASPEECQEEIVRPAKKIVGRKKPRKLNSLDISSGDDNYSDEDFKGTTSTDEEDEEDLDDVVTDSSEEASGYGRKNGPVRRSTRARIARYDREFINDDSDEDDAPRRKKTRSAWDESESEESDGSWGGRRGRKKARGAQKSRKPSVKRKRSKKKKKRNDDSDSDAFKRKRKPKVKYGRIGSDNEDLGIRTRGKKINYLDVLGSDSDDDVPKRSAPKIAESEEEYVVNEEDVLEEELENNRDTSDEEETGDEDEDDEKLASVKKGTAISLSPSAVDKLHMTPVVQLEKTQLTEIRAVSHPDELNPIEEINKNIEEMSETDMEKLMEEESYANKQLALVALQIEKEKRRKEQEANKNLEVLLQHSQKSSKKRGRNDPSDFAVDLMMGDYQENAELSEPPGVALPIFADLPMSNSPEDTPKKRKGRGKGKKTLAAEAAKQAAENTSVASVSSPVHTTTTAAKLSVAAPPQPFAQSQPAPSVITRMLQSQSYPVSTSSAYYAGEPQHPDMVQAGGGGQYIQGAGRVPVTSPYRAAPPQQQQQQQPISPYHMRSGGPPQQQQLLRNPNQNHPSPSHIYPQAHRTMDPSPSGGGPITSISSQDRNSPALIPPPADSPLSNKSESTPTPPPPPPPYNRSSMMRFPPSSNGSAMGAASGGLPPPARHVPMMQGHVGSARPNSMPPYPHPTIPPNYFGSYGPPPPLVGSDDALPPSAAYQTPPYPEHYGTDGPGLAAISENSSSKGYEDESGGEFGGLVSYFSSQREDDLDT